MDVFATRRFNFSASHRYWREEWSLEQNEAVFGKCTNRYGHGHNYELFVTVAGAVDPITGMVMNMVELKRLVTTVLDQFDHKHLNEDTPYFRDVIPTTENLVRVLWGLIEPQLPKGVRLAKLRLYENSDLYAEYFGLQQQATFNRRYEFSAAHRLHAQSLTDEANREIYGKCNNPNGHGHNYQLEVTVDGLIDAQTGMVIDLVDMDRRVQSVLDNWDHRHLDYQVAEFAEQPSTAENIVVVLWQRLEALFGSQLKHLRLWETANNVFDYPLSQH